MKNLSSYNQDLSVPRKKDVDALETKVDSKQDTIIGGASTITTSNLTANRALVSNGSGKVAASVVTSTELGYLDGVTSNVQAQLNKKIEKIYDNNILFGGSNIVGGVSPVDAALDLNVGGNKAAFSNPNGITIEYTNDGGVTWLDYGATDLDKVELVTLLTNRGFFIGKKTSSTDVTINDMLRVSVNATACGFYTFLKKILMFVSTNGAKSFKVKIEKATIGQPEVFSDIGTYAITGWSGWNSIPLSLYFGGNSMQVSQILVLRFTFYLENDSHLSNAYVSFMSFIGITNWVSPSSLASTNHLYSFDAQQNASFPANVMASKFIGNGSNLTNIPYPVTSVNTKTGAVQLNATDVGALPDDTVIPTVNDATLTIKRNGINVGSFTANSANDVSIDINVPTDKSDIGLGNVANERQYSDNNPPPYPIYGVNGDTGDVYTQPYKVNGTVTGATITGTIEAPEDERNKIVLVTGTAVILTPDADCPPQCVFNFNGLGARIIVRFHSDTNNNATALGNSVGWLKANIPVLLIYYRISDTNGQWIIQNMSRPVATDLVATGAKGQVLGFTARNKIGAMDAPAGTKIVVNSATPVGLSSGDLWYQID